MLRAIVLAGVLVAGVSGIAFTVEGEKLDQSGPADVMQPYKQQSPPAKVYSGSAAIDRSRGVAFTNGTYGYPNEEYEAFSKGTPEAPGLTSANYPFAQKDRFVSIVDDLMNIYREGAENLKHNKDTRPELISYREKMGAALHDKLDAAEKALKSAKSSNQSNWDEAQKNTRIAFNELQALFVRKP